jgi:hypothetical protein
MTQRKYYSSLTRIESPTPDCRATQARLAHDATCEELQQARAACARAQTQLATERAQAAQERTSFEGDCCAGEQEDPTLQYLSSRLKAFVEAKLRNNNA